jgi:hypothetical protein
MERRQSILFNWWLYPIIGLLCIIFLFIGVSIGEKRVQPAVASQQINNQTTQQQTVNQAAQSVTAAPTAEQAAAPAYYSLGDTITFDGLEITFNSAGVQPIDNQYADFVDTIVIHVTAKNIIEESKGFNMFYATMFGPSGTEAENVSTYFDDSIEWAGDMRPQASLEGTFAYKYAGDGEYILELEDWTGKTEVRFDIVKQ